MTGSLGGAGAITTVRVCGCGTSGIVSIASRGGGSGDWDAGDERTGWDWWAGLEESRTEDGAGEGGSLRTGECAMTAVFLCSTTFGFAGATEAAGFEAAAGGLDETGAGFCPLSVAGVCGGVFTEPDGTMVLVADRMGGSSSAAAAPGIGGALGITGEPLAPGEASSNGGESVTAERDCVDGEGTTIGSGPLWVPAGSVFLPFCSVTRPMVAEAHGEGEKQIGTIATAWRADRSGQRACGVPPKFRARRSRTSRAPA